MRASSAHSPINSHHHVSIYVAASLSFVQNTKKSSSLLNENSLHFQAVCRTLSSMPSISCAWQSCRIKVQARSNKSRNTRRPIGLHHRPPRARTLCVSYFARIWFRKVMPIRINADGAQPPPPPPHRILHVYSYIYIYCYVVYGTSIRRSYHRHPTPARWWLFLFRISRWWCRGILMRRFVRHIIVI